MKAPAPVSVRALRDAVEARRLEIGLRGTAREIGISPTGLGGVLDGRSPYTHTRDRITRWYVATAGQRAALDAEAAGEILRQLTAHLPDGVREKAIRKMLADVAQLGREAKAPAPPWLMELTEETEKG